MMRTNFGMVQWMAKDNSEFQNFKRADTNIRWVKRLHQTDGPAPGHYCYLCDRSTMEGVSLLQGMHLPIGISGIVSDSCLLARIHLLAWLGQWISILLASLVCDALLLHGLVDPFEICKGEKQDKLLEPRRHQLGNGSTLVVLQRAIVQQYVQKSRQLGDRSGILARTPAFGKGVIKSSEDLIWFWNGDLKQCKFC